MRFIGLMTFALQIAGLLIHLWTTFLLFQIYGLFGAIASFFMPVISQIYLFIFSWNVSGIFLTQYNLVILTYLLSWIVLLTVSAYLLKDSE